MTTAKEPRVTDYVTPRLEAALRPEKIDAEAARRHLPAEELVFNLMKGNPALFGAMSDWDDIGLICIGVMRELKPFMSYVDMFRLVLQKVHEYDTQVICVIRAFSDVRRLAYFVNEMVETLLENDGYRRMILKTYDLDERERLVMRGIVLNRITTAEIREVLLSDRCRYFETECLFAERITGSRPSNECIRRTTVTAIQ